MIEGELGAFLRNKREATSPESVGLSSGPRRRTPGLRRSELATLAGVSVDYLIRIEQGRDTNPSGQVLAALAAALRFTEGEMDHLRLLTIAGGDHALCPSLRPAARTVRAPVRALLDRLEPTPAIVVNHLSDVLAWTEGYDRLMRPLGLLDADPPNLVTYAFTDERALTTYPDWGDIAADMAAALHAEQRNADDDTHALAARLGDVAGARFGDVWSSVAVSARKTGVHAVAHPDVGVLRLAFEVLDLPDPDRQKMITYLPADEATATGLDRLAGRTPGHLRAVAQS